MTYQESGQTSVASNPIVRRTLAAALLLAAGGLLGSACADNESSLFIRGCKLRSGDDCSVDNEVSGTYVSKGFVDAAFYKEFYCDLLVGNQVVQRGSSDQLRTETSRIELYEADVRVVDLGGDPVAYQDGSSVEFTVPITGFVDPGSGSDPGYGLASVTMLDGGSLVSLRGSLAAPQDRTEVIAYVKVRGRTLGGQELESPEWPLPISACSGCRCVNTPDPICCVTPADTACSDLDDPALDQCTSSDVYDCRILGQTCQDFLASL